MTPPARVQAAIEILDAVIAASRDNGPPADALIADWFRTRRFAGSKDRRAIREIVWQAVRLHGDPPRDGRTALAANVEWHPLFDGSPYGPAALETEAAETTPNRLPRWFCEAMPEWLDENEAAALLERAPLDLRINTAKATVAEVMKAFPEATQIAGLRDALRLPETPGLEAHDLFRSGAIEVQDAGSQHVAALASAQPGENVIDLCAGAGGKTLALAADMHGAGRLIACDTDRGRLSKLMPRAVRAGAGDIETRLLDPRREMTALADLEEQADLVLIDAPCTGSGTWRRSPDLRWRMNAERSLRIETLQAYILDYAQALVRPGGRLVYAVCSVRDSEGVAQVASLASRWKPVTSLAVGRPRGAGRLLTPFHDRTDGFFVAALQKPC